MNNPQDPIEQAVYLALGYRGLQSLRAARKIKEDAEKALEAPRRKENRKLPSNEQIDRLLWTIEAEGMMR